MRHLDQVAPAIGDRQGGGLAAVEGDERAPLAAPAVDVLQAGDGGPVAGVEIEQLLERPDRLGIVAEPLDPQRGHLPEDLDLLLRRDAGKLGLAREDRDEIVPAAAVLVALGQRIDRLAVVRVEREDRVVGVDRHDVAGHLDVIAIDGDDLEQAGDAALDVGGRAALDLLLDEVEERVPLLGAGVEAAQRVARLGGVGTCPVQHLPRLDGLLRVGEVELGDLGDGDRQLALARRVGVGDPLQRLPVDLDQLVGVAAGAQVVAVELERGRVRGVDLANAPEVLLGGVRVAEPLPVQHGDLQERADLDLGGGAAAARLQRVGVEHHQAGPVLLLLVLVGQEGERARLRRVEGDDLLHALDRQVLALEVVAGEVGEGDQRVHPLVGAGGRFDARLEERGEIGPVGAGAQEPLEVGGGAPVARVDVERASQVLLNLRRLRLVAGGGLGGRQVERGGELAVGRALRLVEVLGDHLLPVLAEEIEVGEDLLRVGVVRHQLEDAAEALDRALLVEEVVDVELALLAQELGEPAGVRRRLDLDVEQALDHLELAALAQRLAGGVERAGGLDRGEDRDELLQRGERLIVRRIAVQDR